MLLQGIAAVLTKVASASTIAQVATGVTVTVAGVAGAGAAGVLPGPVQDGVAGAIESVTPFDVPDSHDDRVTGVDDAVRHAEAPESTPAETSPGASPSEIPVVPTPVVSSPSPTTEVEPGDDDGIHQHRGGRTGTHAPGSAPAPSVAPAPVADDSPEVEDHHAEGDDDAGSHDGDDSSGHGGDSSGRGAESSGHGGGDD
jgi:hypothetical protein